MKHGHYDCWIGYPKYKTAKVHGMSWSERNKRRAVQMVKELLALPTAAGKVGIIRRRERGVIGGNDTWHKLPLVWRSDEK